MSKDGQMLVKESDLRNISPTANDMTPDDKEHLPFHTGPRQIEPNISKFMTVETDGACVGAGSMCGCNNADVYERYIDFDEFYEMMKTRIGTERNSIHDHIEFESHSSSVSCVLWPS